MKRSPLLALVTAAIALASIGCTRKQVSDDSLATSIKAQLFSDPATKSANIVVGVKGGVATLSGDVPNNDVELQAMKLANNTPGVARVDDQLKVNSAAAAAPPPENLSAQNQLPASLPNTATPAPAPQATPAPQTPTAAPIPQVQPVPQPQSAPAPRERPAPERVAMTVPAGSHVSVQMIDSVNSAHNAAGEVFRATLYAPLVAHGATVIPAGAPVSVLLADAKGAGRIKGNSELELRLSQIEYRGHTYPVTSSIYEEVGKGRGKSTAVRTGIGAAAGAVIGALAGGGKGAAIGTVVGGGGTAGYQLATHGQQVKVASETVLNFRLEAPLTVERIVR